VYDGGVVVIVGIGKDKVEYEWMVYFMMWDGGGGRYCVGDGLIKSGALTTHYYSLLLLIEGG